MSITAKIQFFLILVVFSTTPAHAGKRLALVIGNSEYQQTPLPNSTIHAQALSQKLHQLGFKVNFLKNTNRYALSQAIHDWGQQLQDDDIGFFYYAGHGAQVDGENYLIPIDNAIKSEHEVPHSAVSLNSVFREIVHAKNSVNIVIVNANHRSPYKNAHRRSSRGLRHTIAPVGTVLIYPMAPTEETPDNSGRYEYFTRSLIEHIDTPELNLKQLMNLIRLTVQEKTQGDQIPWQNNNLTGNFFFTAKNKNVNNNDTEYSFWQQVKQENTAYYYKQYLKYYPKGLYKLEAFIAIHRLLGSNKGWELMQKADYLYFNQHKASHAFRMYQQAAQQGNLFAMASLAKLWKTGVGTGVGSNIEKREFWKKNALTKIEQLAKMGHTNSQYQLASLYYEVDENHQLAEKWFRKAAEKGHALAQSSLGNMYLEGQNVKQSYFNANEWLHKAADQGDATGQSLIGKLYETGKGVQQSDTLAVAWYRKAAVQGNAQAQHWLGMMYKKGLGVEQSNVQAITWFRKAVMRGDAIKHNSTRQSDQSVSSIVNSQQKLLTPIHKQSEQHQPTLQQKPEPVIPDKKDQNQTSKTLSTSKTHQDSIDVITEKIKEASVDFIKKEAEQGHAPAQNELGFMYSNGIKIAQNDAKALAWFSKAASQGHTQAQNNLGYLYLSGKGVTQNYVKALAWFYKAADQKNTQAQNNIGFMYSKGKGVAQDDTKAMTWYRKAAIQGDSQAQFNLGFMYLNGKGATKNSKKAANWYRKAAKQGHAQAQFNLGWMYYKGTGVNQNNKEAIFWLEKSAEQGFAQAQNNLGWMYKNAKGVAQNDSQSLTWYKKSAKQGFLASQEYLINLGEDW